MQIVYQVVSFCWGSRETIRAAHALARWSLLNFVLGCFDALRGPPHFILSISQDLASVLDIFRSWSLFYQQKFMWL